MPLDAPLADSNFGYPPSLIRCTTSWEEALATYRECGRFILRNPHNDPAIYEYTDRICSGRFGDFLKDLHEFEMKVFFRADGRIVGECKAKRAPDCLQHKATGLLQDTITFTLDELFIDPDAGAYITGLEAGVRAARVILGNDLMLSFRTKDTHTEDTLAELFHEDDRGETFGINLGPSDTQFGAPSSFTRQPNMIGIQYRLKEGHPTYAIQRGDWAILNIPHRPGVSTLASGNKLWAGAYKLRQPHLRS